MRSRVAVFTLITLLLATGFVYGQMSRSGGMGVARGGAQGLAPRSSSVQGVQRGHVIGSQPQVVIQQFHRSHPRHRSGRAVTSRSVGRAPSLSVNRTHLHRGFFPHRHCHFHKPRGIVIIEVPRFLGTSVTTHVVPGSRWVEPPLAFADSRVRSPGQLAPFDPTPQEVVERMLELAGIKKGDVVYDLGSGDGRVVITAAKKYGAKAVGFEIDPGLVKLAREKVRKDGLEDLVQIREQDFTKADLSAATVVTLYLSQDGNETVKPLLLSQLKPGARVVSYTFDMGDWTPKITEAYRDAAGDTHLLYYWEISEPPGLS